MSNYAATVVKINNIRPHSNADRLNCTNIFGNNVIIGKDVQIGDKGLFFPVESQLGEQFCLANDLIRRKDANGKAVGGMFDEVIKEFNVVGVMDDRYQVISRLWTPLGLPILNVGNLHEMF